MVMRSASRRWVFYATLPTVFQPREREKLRTVQLHNVKAYIDSRLGDPTLKLADVAGANRISIR